MTNLKSFCTSATSRPIHDPDHRQQADLVCRQQPAWPSGNSVIATRKAAVRAQLHHHARQQHRGRRRRGHVAGRRPGVERPQAGQNREADKHERKRPALKACRERKLAPARPGSVVVAPATT